MVTAPKEARSVAPKAQIRTAHWRLLPGFLRDVVPYRLRFIVPGIVLRIIRLESRRSAANESQKGGGDSETVSALPLGIPPEALLLFLYRGKYIDNSGSRYKLSIILPLKSSSESLLQAFRVQVLHGLSPVFRRASVASEAVLYALSMPSPLRQMRS